MDAAGGRVALQPPAGYIGSWTFAVSGDGGIAVGAAAASSGYNFACRWQGTGPGQVIGTLPGGQASWGTGISRDGAAIVGASDWNFMNGPMQAYRWTAGGMVGLGFLPNYVDSSASAVSDDHTVVVGYLNDLGGNSRSFRWTAGGGMVDIGSFGPLNDDFAGDVTADGSVVVGGSNGRPYRWTAATGLQPLPLPSWADNGWADAVTRDGSLIVGTAAAGLTRRAVYWDAGGVHELMATLGPALPAGWTLESASGVSDDGRTIVGSGRNSAVREGWVAEIGVSPCFANCDGSTAPPILNVSDFICFQTKFAAGDPGANCDGSTSPPVLNVNDFICFQGAFAAGCP